MATIVVAMPADADGDSEAEWVVARPGSVTTLGEHDDYTFADAHRGLLALGSSAPDGRTHLEVLDATGERVASLELPALSARARVLLTPDGRSAYVLDDEIQRVDLETSDRVVPVDESSPYRDEAGLSPNGRVLASSSCGDESCRVTSVIGDDVTSIDRFVLLGVGDEYLIGYQSNSARSWLAYSIEDGTTMALEAPMEVAWDGYALDDGRFLLTGSDERGNWSMALWDPPSGVVTPVIDDIEGYVVYEFSPSSRWAVVGPRQGLETVVAGAAPLRVVDLTTGEFVVDVSFSP